MTVEPASPREWKGEIRLCEPPCRPSSGVGSPPRRAYGGSTSGDPTDLSSGYLVSSWSSNLARSFRPSLRSCLTPGRCLTPGWCLLWIFLRGTSIPARGVTSVDVSEQLLHLLIECHHLIIESPYILVMVSLLIVDSSNHLLTSIVEGIIHVGLTLLESCLHSFHSVLVDSLNVLLKSF